MIKIIYLEYSAGRSCVGRRLIGEEDPADEISEAACGASGFHAAQLVDASAIGRAGLAALVTRRWVTPLYTQVDAQCFRESRPAHTT